MRFVATRTSCSDAEPASAGTALGRGTDSSGACAASDELRDSSVCGLGLVGPYIFLVKVGKIWGVAGVTVTGVQ